ncbi:MAG: DNA-directed RNA polymerase subunit L [Nanoarchaeota archaeon]|nr:DNA-directed RNA polymerase subunit L [Nanoarchaeota archaeon]
MVEIEIIQKEKNKLKFKVKGENHTILNLLRKELFNDESVEFAGYMIEHPLTGVAIFSISTKNKTARKALTDAISRLQKKISNFESEVKKI